jgi:hypothetical protein
MNHWLDQSLVGLLLAASAGYALLTLGPKTLRKSILAAMSKLAAGAPRVFGLAQWAQRLQAAAAAKPKGTCGGCEDCGTGTTSSNPTASGAPSTPREINIPPGKIGRRSGRRSTLPS